MQSNLSGLGDTGLLNDLDRLEKIDFKFLQGKKTFGIAGSDFLMVLHALVLDLSELQAGVMKLEDCLGTIRTPRFEEFVTFLKVMETYGSGY